MRIVATVLMAVVLLFTAACGGGSSANDTKSNLHYGETASTVAKSIDCTGFIKTVTGESAYSNGVCHLKGNRVNVITFKNKQQQTTWNRYASAGLGENFYWASGHGVVIVAKNGSRSAAETGTRAVAGVLHETTGSGGVPAPKVFNASDVAKAIGLNKSNFVKTPSGVTCEAAVIMTDKATVDMYANAGDLVATNPDGTAGVKNVSEEAKTCQTFFTTKLKNLK